LTGEARFHRAVEAEALGMGLVTCGHYATERPGVEDLAGRIVLAFPSLVVWPSQSERDPFRVASAGTQEAPPPPGKAKI
jgi:putative NIF3 family GTP cyclohydrolase 1 type 2